MIWESGPWKNDLLRRADILRQLKDKVELTEEDLITVELTVMTAFYIVRKLIEAKTKLTTVSMNKEVSLCVYQATGKKVTLLNWHKIDEAFDMESEQVVIKNLRFLCNQFIHSYIFTPVQSELGGLDSILFSSDREKNNSIYKIHVDVIIDLLKYVGNDNPDLVIMVMDQKSGDYKVSTY